MKLRREAVTARVLALIAGLASYSVFLRSLNIAAGTPIGIPIEPDT